MAPLSLKIILEEGTVCRTILFSTTTTVREANEIVLEKFHNSLDQEKAYGLFVTSADDEKSGIWLESHRNLEYYMLRDGDTLQYLCKTRNMRVRMLDGSVKTLQVDESKPVGELLYQICSKIGITNHDEYGFCREDPQEVEEIKPTTGTLTLKRKIQKDKDVKMEQLSKKLHTDDNVEWLNQLKTLRELSVHPTETLLLKRRLFYSDRKIDSRDPVQLNLLYVQTRDDILSGRQVTTEENAIEFAGIQCQVHFGDFDEEKHKPGFIENLAEYLPKSYVSWSIEKKIYREYRKHIGLSQLDAKYLYTQIARKHPTYGVTFFLVKEQEKGKKKMVPRLLGINANSILRLDEKTKEIQNTWLLTQVKSYHAGKSTFTLNFGDYSDKEYAVKTNEADRIRDILEGYIDIIRKKLEGPSNVTYDEGMVICEDNVEKSQATIIQTVVPQRLIEHSIVGPSKLISHELGQETRHGTQIVTVQQLLMTKRGDMKQQAMIGMTGCMPVDFNRRINHFNSQSVKAVMLLGDPSRANLDQVRTISEDLNAELPGIIQGVEELASHQTSEEDKKKLLDDLEQIRKYLLEFSSSTKKSDLGNGENLENAEEAAKKLAELSSLLILSSDPKIKRRSELLRRSRNSFIADERVEATLRRASFLAVASSASKSVVQAIATLDKPCEGPPINEEEKMKFKSSAADKLAKLNAAVALLLASRADPKNVDYETAVNSMTTINELTPSLIEDAKVVSNTKNGDKHLDLLNQINALCQCLNSLCNLTDTDEDSEIHNIANKYAESSGKLIYIFNPKKQGKPMLKTDPDKANEIIDLARKLRDRTSKILVVTSELTQSACTDPRAKALDELGVKCADSALGLVACSQITAPTIHEPHCQSALTAAVENFSSSAQQLTAAWKPLVEDQQYQKHENKLNDYTSKLMKTLDHLKKSYKKLDADDGKPELQPKPLPKPRDTKKLQFITSLSAAKHSAEEIQRELEETKKDLDGKPVKHADNDKIRLRLLLSQKIAQLNAAMGSLVHATCDTGNPDYETAAAAIDIVNELQPQILRDTKDMCQYENDKTRKEMLEDIAELCKASACICAAAENSNIQDMYDAASTFADSSGKLCYVFNPKALPEKENQILDLSRSACEKASEMLSKVYQLAEAVGGDEGSQLDNSGTKVVGAAQGLLTVAQITAPSMGDERCQSALIKSADRVSNLTQDVVSLWEPLIKNPEYHSLGDDLNKDRESLEALLEKLKKACEPSNEVQNIETVNGSSSKEKQRLTFIMSTTAAKNNLAEAEKLLHDIKDVAGIPHKSNKDTPIYKDLQRLNAQKLDELNAAVAALMRATTDTSNIDYETAESAVTTISQLTPDIIRNTTELCQYVDDKQRVAMLDNVRSLCKANKLICDSLENNNIQELNNAANKFATSSGKLCYIFKPRANSMKENQILDLAREACENTSLMLSRVYELAEKVGGEEGSTLDSVGSKVVDAAQILLTNAQITGVSMSDPRCQSELIKSADTVSNRTDKLATVWEPIIQKPDHQDIGKQIIIDRKKLDENLEKLKNACRVHKDKTENFDDLGEKQRLKFKQTALGASNNISDAKRFLHDNTEILMQTKELKKNTPEYEELQRISRQKLAELNAAIAALMYATSDSLNPDYKSADTALSTISRLTPEIVQNASKLCEYEDKNQRHAMLEHVKAMCTANQLICDCMETNNLQNLRDGADKYMRSSGKLYYVFDPLSVPLLETQIVNLSKAAYAKTSEMLSDVKEMSNNIGGEEAGRLESSGSRLFDAAHNLMTTAHITAPSITDSRCQSELVTHTDLMSNLSEVLASNLKTGPWTSQPLKHKIIEDRNTLETILENLREACDPQSDIAKLTATMSGIKGKLDEAEKILENSDKCILAAEPLQENSSDFKKLHRISAQKLAELNATVAGLVAANSDMAHPDYETTAKELSKMLHLTPEIVQSTKNVSEYVEPKRREEMLGSIKELMKAIKQLYESVENGDNKTLNNRARTFANCSGKLYHELNPPLAANSIKENLLLDLSKAVDEKTSGMLYFVDYLSKSVGVENIGSLNTSATRVAEAAEELKTISQITAPSVEDSRCQATLVASAKNLSALVEDLSSKWTPIVQSSKFDEIREKLSNNKKDLDKMVEKLIAECTAKPVGPAKSRKPEPPVRKVTAAPNEDTLKLKHVHFCDSIQIAQDSIRKAKKDLEEPNDNINTGPVVVGAQEKLQNLMEKNLSLAAVAVSRFISDMDPDHMNYDSAIKATKVLAELIPVIVKDGKQLSSTKTDASKQEFLANMLSLCEVSTKLCDTAKNGEKNINDVAVEFGNKTANLLYNVSADVDPGQQKEVIRRVREIGDSVSRLAVRGAEGAAEVKDARVHALCAAATRCADSASDFMYTAKLLAPTIHNPESENYLLEISKQLSSNIKDFSLTWQPLNSNEEHKAFVKDLDTEAGLLRTLLENFNQDLKNRKLVKRKVVEKLVIQDTPLRQLASNILDIVKAKIALSDSSEEKRNMIDYSKKLAAAIEDLDMANAKSRNAPYDKKRRDELEEVVQELQQICLESRIQSGEEKRFVDLMDLINDVSTDAAKLSEETLNVKPEFNKYALITIKSEADDIVKTAADAARPQEITNDEDVIDGTSIIKQFAEKCEDQVDIMRVVIEEIRDDPSQNILRSKWTNLKGSSDLLRFAVNSHIAAVRSATLDANQADFEDLEKNIDSVLQSTNKKNENNGTEAISAAMATATTLCSAVSSRSASEKIPPALAAYLLEMRSGSNLADPKQKLRLEEHLKKLLNLLKTHTMATSRQIATWQENDQGETAEITHQIVQEIDNFNKEKNDKLKHADGELLDQNSLKRLLLRQTETVYGDKKQLSSMLDKQLQKLTSLTEMVKHEFDKREPLRTLHKIPDAAGELSLTVRAFAALDPIKRARIEERADTMCSTTYHFLKTAETASRDSHNPDSHRRFNEAWRLFNESISKLGQLKISQDKMKQDCCEIAQNLQQQICLLQTNYPSNTMAYSACLEPLQNENNLQSIQNEDPMNREECTANLKYLSSMMCHSAELAAQCGYLLSLPEEYNYVAKEGFFNVPRILNITGDVRLACLKIIRCKDIEETNFIQSNINKRVIELKEVVQEAVTKLKEPQAKRDVLEGLQNVDQAAIDLRETLRKSSNIETVMPLATRLLDATEDFTSTVSHVAVIPQVKPSAERKTRSDQVINNAKTMLSKTQSLVNTVGSSNFEVLTWKMFESDRSGLLKFYKQFVNCIVENGAHAGFIATETVTEGKTEMTPVTNEPKKTFIQIQYDLAQKWLTKPASKQEDKSAGIQGVKNIIDLAEKMSVDMKGEEKTDMQGMVEEAKELLEDCNKKYNSEKASLLLERLRELQNMLKWRVVTRVVEDFLEEEPLADFDVLADGEVDNHKRKLILDKKVADLLAQLGKMTRTARFVADAGFGGSDQELLQTKDQMELLAPALVKAAQHRIQNPNNMQAVETYKRVLQQYSESISRLREICDQSVNPMEFAQAAGETIQRIREESTVKTDPQTCANTSRLITRLGLRVIEAGLNSQEAQSDPELKQALAQAQGRLTASTKVQQRASRTPDWRDIAAEILRTTGEVESVLGGENIFQKQPEPDQPIYAAALDLHAAVREWSARDNEIVAVAKRMAVQMARLSDYMNSERKGELLSTSKDIVASSRQVAALARKLALECTDMRIRKNLMQVCDQIPTISGQLKMLITVKGSTMGSQGTQESREAMDTLVSNAQNLMASIQEVVKAAIGASVKIMSQRGPRIKWVRRACYNYY